MNKGQIYLNYSGVPN